MDGLAIAIPNDVLEQIVEQVRARLGHEAAEPRSPWLTADEAAEYLRCKTSRIRKLSSAERIPKHREGGRVLYRRDELDAFVMGGGARAG